MQLTVRHSGKSGSGKSSIQSLLFRFYDPDSGKITVNGRGMLTETRFGAELDRVLQIYKSFRWIAGAPPLVLFRRYML
jgi:ABC-type transport system involved in cytochrome bd biosynthesis fused ATPase/permease subunit